MPFLIIGNRGRRRGGSRERARRLVTRERFNGESRRFFRICDTSKLSLYFSPDPPRRTSILLGAPSRSSAPFLDGPISRSGLSSIARGPSDRRARVPTWKQIVQVNRVNARAAELAAPAGLLPLRPLFVAPAVSVLRSAREKTAFREPLPLARRFLSIIPYANHPLSSARREDVSASWRSRPRKDRSSADPPS